MHPHHKEKYLDLPRIPTFDDKHYRNLENHLNGSNQQQINDIAFGQMMNLSIKYETTISYLIVGACDGSSGNMEHQIFKKYKLGNFYGILLEPSPLNFGKLKEKLKNFEFDQHEAKNQLMIINAAFSDNTNYGNNDTNKKFVQLQVIDVHKLARFNNVSADEIAHWKKYQIGTLLSIKNKWSQFRKNVSVEAVNSMDSRQQLVQNENMHQRMDRKGVIDAIQVDTEGFDAVVVRNYILWSLDYNNGMLPMYIQFEHKIIGKFYPQKLILLNLFLRQHGYELIE